MSYADTPNPAPIQPHEEVWYREHLRLDSDEWTVVEPDEDAAWNRMIVEAERRDYDEQLRREDEG